MHVTYIFDYQVDPASMHYGGMAATGPAELERLWAAASAGHYVWATSYQEG